MSILALLPIQRAASGNEDQCCAPATARLYVLCVCVCVWCIYGRLCVCAWCVYGRRCQGALLSNVRTSRTRTHRHSPSAPVRAVLTRVFPYSQNHSAGASAGPGAVDNPAWGHAPALTRRPLRPPEKNITTPHRPHSKTPPRWDLHTSPSKTRPARVPPRTPNSLRASHEPGESRSRGFPYLPPLRRS